MRVTTFALSTISNDSSSLGDCDTPDQIFVSSSRQRAGLIFGSSVMPREVLKTEGEA
jgi:hypothetical protein